VQHQVIARRHRRQHASFHFAALLLGKDIAGFARARLIRRRQTIEELLALELI
jgi:hypothetical protein